MFRNGCVKKKAIAFGGLCFRKSKKCWDFMSSFTCEKCGKEIIDSHKGYVTACEHYPRRLVRVENLKLSKKAG